MICRQIPPDAALIAWPVIAPLLRRALDHSLGEYSLGDVRDAVLKGDMTLFAAVEGYRVMGVMVAQVLPFPAKRVLHVLLLGGEKLAEWQPSMDRVVSEWGRANGCTIATAYCRPGMARVLCRDGQYQAAYTVVSRTLEDTR